MKEYLLLVRKDENHESEHSAEEHQQHVQNVSNYIQELTKEGKFIDAQPLEMQGMIIAGSASKLKDGPFNETKEVIAGYFLIKAESLEEAVELAKKNPALHDSRGARMEVRPIKVLPGING